MIFTNKLFKRDPFMQECSLLEVWEFFLKTDLYINLFLEIFSCIYKTQKIRHRYSDSFRFLVDRKLLLNTFSVRSVQ